MHTKPKTQAQRRTKKSFQWDISSRTISFMQPSEVEHARDGSYNDCGAISPIPIPRRGASAPTESRQ